MSSKYAADLVVIKTKKTLSVAPHFLAAMSDIDEHPLHIVGETSRFRVTIINEEKKTTTARWSVKDLRQIKATVADARSYTNFSKWSRKSSQAVPADASHQSPAYTTRFVMGNGLKGKTPAEVYAENPENFKARMEAQYHFIAGNLGKNDGKYDETNKKQMAAIKDALRLLANGALTGEAANAPAAAEIIPIYQPVMKPLIRETNKETGLTPVYTTEVNVYPANTYPVEVIITNFNAPVEQQPNGTLNVKASAKCDERINKMLLSFADFENMLQEMEDYVETFKMLNARKCFAESEKCINENKRETAARKAAGEAQQSTKGGDNKENRNAEPAAPQCNLHVRSIDFAKQNMHGDYEFMAQTDSKECVKIQIPAQASARMGPSLLQKFIAKTKTAEGADFSFTGEKCFVNGEVVYKFHHFAPA